MTSNVLLVCPSYIHIFDSVVLDSRYEPEYYDSIDIRVDTCLLHYTLEVGMIGPIKSFIMAVV